MKYKSEQLFDPCDAIHDWLDDADYRYGDQLLESGKTEQQVIRYMRGWGQDKEYEAKCFDDEIANVHANQ